MRSDDDDMRALEKRLTAAGMMVFNGALAAAVVIGAASARLIA